MNKTPVSLDPSNSIHPNFRQTTGLQASPQQQGGALPSNALSLLLILHKLCDYDGNAWGWVAYAVYRSQPLLV
jgi:hypothetical protein